MNVPPKLEAWNWRPDKMRARLDLLEKVAAQVVGMQNRGMIVVNRFGGSPDLVYDWQDGEIKAPELAALLRHHIDNKNAETVKGGRE